MPLSESERQILDALEASLKENDPKFVKTMSRVDASSAGSHSFSPRNVILGVLALIVGIVIILFGVSLNLIVLGILGFLIMGASGWLMFKKVYAPTELSTPKPQSPFMKKLEEQWDERKRREGMQ